MIETVKTKAGSYAKVSKKSGTCGILQEIQAADTPTRTGDGSRRQVAKLSDDTNRANKNRFISESPEKNTGEKLSDVACDLRKGVLAGKVTHPSPCRVRLVRHKASTRFLLLLLPPQGLGWVKL